MRNTFNIVSLGLFLLISFSIQGQEIEDIVERHKNNTRSLYQSRGISSGAIFTGDVTYDDLIAALDGYVSKVGMLIYTHENDILTVTLLTQEGSVRSEKQSISADSLAGEIRKANRWFSADFNSRNATKRGDEIHVRKETKYDQWKAVDRMNDLLLPFRESLLELEHLIIVPTLNIGTLPFAAFRITSTSYLIDEMSYSIAPSLYEVMVLSHMNRSKVDDPFAEIYYDFTNSLFVGNPSFPEDSIWTFPELPGTLKEITYITSSLDSSSFTFLSEEEATISNIVPGICDYDLIYFATHGISSSVDPLDNSFLVLAESDDGDELLRAKTIQDFSKRCKLKADLVVLSACQTGLGKDHEGGVIGLSRAFQIAGANHVLMSLWSINDEETATLMTMFFDHLKTGSQMMPHAAMRKAIIEYKKDVNPKPNYWASFSIFGIPF